VLHWSLVIDFYFLLQIVKKGSGKLIPQNGRVWFDYIAFAEGKDSPFDSTLNRGFPEVASLNDSGCVQGLGLGLKSMEYGEIAKFWTHYDYAYGKYGSPPRIPAGP
jgi:FKBP-type peptidyl-prolyl cis-trans isomerase